MLLLLLACLPKYEPGVAWAPHHEPLAPALTEVFANQTHDVVFDEAVARRKAGDTRGAIERLAWLERQRAGDFAVLYQLGMAYEGAADFEAALMVYDRMAQDDPDRTYVLDWGFRRAMCLEELGRYEEALAEYRSLPKSSDPRKAAVLELATAIAELRSGRGSPGTVERSIAAAAEQEDTEWIQAKGHIAIAVTLLESAEDLSFDQRQGRQVRHLRQRAALIVEAEGHIAATVRLEQVEWILRGMLALGDAYAAMADDLLLSRPPRGVDANAYQQALQEKSRVIRAKAYTAYDQGLIVAGKFSVDSWVTRALAERRDSLVL